MSATPPNAHPGGGPCGPPNPLAETRLRENVFVSSRIRPVGKPWRPSTLASSRRAAACRRSPTSSEPYLPSRVLDGNITLDLSGTEVRLLHPGGNHTPGDAVAHLPVESVVVCGDLVSSGYHVNYEDASPANLDRGLETLRAFGARVVIPGHGAPGGPELLDRQSSYHSAIRGAVLSALGPEEVLARIRSRFPGYLLEEVLPSAFKAAW